MKLFWMIMAGIGVGVAAIALWFQHTDVAFVAATLGAVAWFLHYRRQIKESITPREPEAIDNEGMDDLDEEDSHEE